MSKQAEHYLHRAYTCGSSYSYQCVAEDLGYRSISDVAPRRPLMNPAR